MRRLLMILLLAPGPVLAAPESWALHGQATIIEQYHPAFRSAYRGPNSLDPGSRGDETVTAALYGGMRPWDGGEAWADGEIDQGFGLSDTLGVAGFTNGEGSKVGRAEPYFRLHRLFFRQTFDLGGEDQNFKGAANQLGGHQSDDRLIVTLGKFSTVDLFDTNDYAHDAANDFLNWAIIDTGSFDYAADAWGYTYGGAVEWTTGEWSLRTGLFDLSRVPNGTELTRGFGQYQIDGEVERRFQLFGHDGKAKLLGFLSRGRFGSYADAVARAQITGLPADIAAVRRPSFRSGVALNVQQGLTDDLGAFLRAGWDDGSHESVEFTDIDNTVALGLSLKGASWDRGADTVGLALESAGLSRSGRNFLAAGGLGILVGDGALIHAARENIVEAYYSLSLHDGVRLTADYQFIADPAYNADRGPVSVLGLRLHGEF